jgi:hypothetical protein
MTYGLPPGAILYPPPGATIIPAAPPGAPAAPATRVAQTPPPKPAVVRGQAPGDAAKPVRAPVAMPSPEQLNVAARLPEGAPDWSAAHKRMQDLGVVTYQMDRPNGDVYQFTCLLSSAQPGRTHRIEAHGKTEAEAVRSALDEAQRWREQRQ